MSEREVSRWLEGGEVEGGLGAELGVIRGRLRGLPEDGWGSEPGPDVSVDMAWAAVGGACVGLRRGRGGWAELGLRLATSAAAALLVVALGAPAVLRLRLQAAYAAESEGAREWAPRDPGGVFWTSSTKLLAPK